MAAGATFLLGDEAVASAAALVDEMIMYNIPAAFDLTSGAEVVAKTSYAISSVFVGEALGPIISTSISEFASLFAPPETVSLSQTKTTTIAISDECVAIENAAGQMILIVAPQGGLSDSIGIAGIFADGVWSNTSMSNGVAAISLLDQKGKAAGTLRCDARTGAVQFVGVDRTIINLGLYTLGTGQQLKVSFASGGATQIDIIDTASGNSLGYLAIDNVGGVFGISSNIVNETIYLGSGTDYVAHAGAGTVINVGTGSDVLAVSNDVLVVGAKATDSICSVADYVLTGGLRYQGSESPYAIGSDGTRYGIDIKGDLIVENNLNESMSIANYVGGPGAATDTAGIYVGTENLSAYNILSPMVPSNWQAGQFAYVNAVSKAYSHTAIYQGVDPLVLDLNGDGFNLTDESIAAPTFDMNNNGFSVQTGWVQPSDGFLVLDKNGDGKIDNAGEMFGNSSTSGFAALAAYDSNGDGITETGELETLAQAGITSINLGAAANDNYARGRERRGVSRAAAS